MTDRLLDFSESPAALSTENGLLVVRVLGRRTDTVPLADIAAVVTSHRQVVLTQNLIAELGKAGAVLICCDERHHPVSMLLPLEGHHAQAERFRAQAAVSAPIKKRVWQELIREKLEMQSAVLHSLQGDDGGIGALAPRVRSGDPENIEATAAHRYWPRLFGDSSFRRGDPQDGRNALLNYGYSLLRALTARAICAAGLHPSLGVHHSNRYNAFGLADDLMEPLRPLMDCRVAEICRDWLPDQWVVNKTAKLALLSVVAGRYVTGGESRTLFDIVSRRAQRLALLFLGQARKLDYEPIEIPS